MHKSKSSLQIMVLLWVFFGGSHCFYKGKGFMGYGDLGNFGQKSVLKIR